MFKQFEKNDELFFLDSKKNIDNYLLKKDYKRAFGLLIIVLEKLGDNQKKELINYYSENLIKFYF
jgi:hypothetical protein